MALPKEAIALIKSFEGYLKRLNDGTDRVKPYLCPANVPTIGYGNTRYPDGRKVRMSDPPITEAVASEYFASELREDEASVDRLLKRQLHELSRGATVSFTYNCGAGALAKSGFLRAVNAGRWDDVPRELAKWRMGGGRVLAGLERRRRAEAALFLKGVAAAKRGDLPAKPAPTIKENQPSPAPVPVRRGFWRSFFDRLFK